SSSFSSAWCSGLSSSTSSSDSSCCSPPSLELSFSFSSSIAPEGSLLPFFSFTSNPFCSSAYKTSVTHAMEQKGKQQEYLFINTLLQCSLLFLLSFPLFRCLG